MHFDYGVCTIIIMFYELFKVKQQTANMCSNLKHVKRFLSCLEEHLTGLLVLYIARKGITIVYNFASDGGNVITFRYYSVYTG